MERHKRDWMSLRDRLPARDTPIEYRDYRNPWQSAKGGWTMWKEVLRHKPATFGELCDQIIPLGLPNAKTEKAIWGHVSWILTWREADGFPFIRMKGYI
jgi:hypothetical protein